MSFRDITCNLKIEKLKKFLESEKTSTFITIKYELIIIFHTQKKNDYYVLYTE